MQPHQCPQCELISWNFLRTVDTDVVVLAINAVECLRITELWVGFGIVKRNGLNGHSQQRQC